MNTIEKPYKEHIIICIQNKVSSIDDNCFPLTIGKKYNAKIDKTMDKDYVVIIDDEGNNAIFSLEIFITLDEWRNNQIDTILYEK